MFDDAALSRVIVFTRTKRGADRVARTLDEAGVDAAAIHGNKSQGQRERALGAFRAGQTRALVATDIAARGIDIDGVTHVVNFELPEVAEAYVHRIGRTARAGNAGRAISLCDHAERDLLRAIERLTRLDLPKADRRGAAGPKAAPVVRKAAKAVTQAPAQRPHHSPHRDARSAGQPVAKPRPVDRRRSFRSVGRQERKGRNLRADRCAVRPRPHGEPGGGGQPLPVPFVNQRHGTCAAVELGRGQRADDDDGVPPQQQDRRRPRLESDRLGERGAARTRAAPGRHHERAPGDRRAPLRVPAIDDSARRQIEPAPEAQWLVEPQRRALGRARNERDRVHDERAHSRTTLPARAEATHSASEPKATSAPRLPGA